MVAGCKAHSMAISTLPSSRPLQHRATPVWAVRHVNFTLAVRGLHTGRAKMPRAPATTADKDKRNLRHATPLARDGGVFRQLIRLSYLGALGGVRAC